MLDIDYIMDLLQWTEAVKSRSGELSLQKG